MPEKTEFLLRLGESAVVRPGLLQAKIEVVYAGMPNDSTYSVVIKWTSGNNSLAYNLYFSNRQKEIVLPAGKMTIVNASSDQLLFKYQR